MATRSTEVAAQPTKTLSGGKVLSYALGDVANNLSFMMTSMFLAAYMTDIAGVPAGVAGTIYGVTKIWAGITDLTAGSTVDKANTKWGRLRPWLLWMSTPLAVVFVLLFSTPAGLSPTMTIVWIFLFDALFQLCYSFINIPYGSLSAALTQDATDRSRLSGARSIASAVTGVALTFIVAPQFDLKGTPADEIRMKFTIIMSVLAVVAVILYLICFKNTREVVPRGAGKMSMGRTLAMAKQNKPMIILIIGAFFLLAAMFTMQAVGMFYARDVLGHAEWYAWMMLAQTVGTILVASALPKMTVLFGKRLTYVGTALTAAMAFALVYFIPANNLPIALAVWFIFGLGQGGSNASMFSMQADTVDYGQWKTGIRSEGGSYSLLSFIRKCGQGIGGWAGLAVVGAFGYISKAGGGVVQTGEALHGIRVAAGLLPCALAIIAALIMLAYRLDPDTHAQIVRELNERRTRSAAGTAMGVDTGSLQVVPVGDGRVFRVSDNTERPIVTIFERDGSGGTEIGPKLAAALGVPFVGQRFSSEQLETADTQQLLRNETGFDKFLRSLNYGATEDSALAQANDLSDRNQMANENTQEVLKAVENGGVVMGRNATMILNSAVGAFHVRLNAPLEKRIERVMYQSGVTDRAVAARRIENEEDLRGRMSQRLFGYDPYDDDYYDLVINTGSVTYDQVVEMIVAMYQSKYPERMPGRHEAGRAAEHRDPRTDDR